MKTGIITRLISYEILLILSKENANFDKLIDNYSLRHSLSLSDRKMVQNIVLGSMRWSLHINKIIKLYVKKKISINQKILLISSISQLVFLDFKEYAVINSTVELAKNKKINASPGFINAVLRNVQKNISKNKLTKVEFNELPKWFTKTTNSWPQNKKDIFVNSILQKPSLHLVFKNTEDINKINIDLIRTTNSSAIILNASQISSIPMYESGNWWVQDFSSMLPISLLKDLSGKKIIDLCSAPGGKSFQLINSGANVDCVEINKNRAKLLESNLKRLGFNSKIIIKDALTLNEKNKYDIVILDAPCSSVGTIRRNPEIFFRKNGPDFKQLDIIQKKLLNKSSEIVKKGGMIVYMVCSFLKFETCDQIDFFLKENKNFSIKKFADKKYNGGNQIINKRGFISTIPSVYENYNIDGFFAAKLIKND
tara:strand:+ start:417 stop:1691 length:1275 start_codon:yes stop_codon:yes gene_type:complete